MNEPDTIDTTERDQAATDPVIELKGAPPIEPDAPDEPANPDAWLQWALIIGLLALFLICALLILIGWNNR